MIEHLSPTFPDIGLLDDLSREKLTAWQQMEGRVRTVGVKFDFDPEEYLVGFALVQILGDDENGWVGMDDWLDWEDSDGKRSVAKLYSHPEELERRRQGIFWRLMWERSVDGLPIEVKNLINPVYEAVKNNGKRWENLKAATGVCHQWKDMQGQVRNILDTQQNNVLNLGQELEDNPLFTADGVYSLNHKAVQR